MKYRNGTHSYVPGGRTPARVSVTLGGGRLWAHMVTRIVALAVYLLGPGPGGFIFGEVYMIDGRMTKRDLSLRENNQGFFPADNVAAVPHSKTLSEYPQLADVFATTSPKITGTAQCTLNPRADSDGRKPVGVSCGFLVENGFIRPAG